MPELRPFEPTWLDRSFKKDLERLSPKEKDERRHELQRLLDALRTSRHPSADPQLQKWRPSAYHVSSLSALYEYRGRFPLRVVARWLAPSPARPEGLVLLVAATLSHDHKRLKALIEGNRREIQEEQGEE